jgi:hypothetical protein
MMMMMMMIIIIIIIICVGKIRRTMRRKARPEPQMKFYDITAVSTAIIIRK